MQGFNSPERVSDFLASDSTGPSWESHSLQECGWEDNSFLALLVFIYVEIFLSVWNVFIQSLLNFPCSFTQRDNKKMAAHC